MFNYKKKKDGAWKRLAGKMF